MPGKSAFYFTLASAVSLGSSLWVGVSQANSYETYLREIETEAKRQATMLPSDSATPAPSFTSVSSSSSGLVGDVERLPLGLEQSAFEKSLREDFIGTYNFYRKLSSENKLRVFQRYQQDNRISTIRDETLSLL
jgi:hypothetical protein